MNRRDRDLLTSSYRRTDYVDAADERVDRYPPRSVELEPSCTKMSVKHRAFGSERRVAHQ